MAEKVFMQNPVTGLTKNGFYGFSWTTFFFGMWPALFRGDFITFLGAFAIFLILRFLTFGVGALIAQIVWAFLYNKYYTRKLISQGYVFSDAPSRNQAAAAAVGQIVTHANVPTFHGGPSQTVASPMVERQQ